VIDQVVLSAANFLTGVIIARSSTKEVFGLYVLGFSIILLAINLQHSLISIPYTVHSSRLQGRDLAEYTGSTLVHQGLASALVICLLCIAWFVAQTTGSGPRGLGPVILTLIVVICFIMFREFIRGIWFARMLVGTALLVDSGTAVMQVGGILALAYLGLLSANAAFWAVGLPCLLVAAGTLILRRGSFRIVSQRIRADFFIGWSFGKWVVASGLLWTASMSVYPWLLAFFHGPASTGVWGACSAVVALASPALGGLQNYLVPKSATLYARQGADALRTFVVRANSAVLGILLVFWLVLVVMGERLVVLMYGKEYTGTGTLIAVLGLSLVAGAVNLTFSRVLFAVERADLDFKVNVVTLVVLLTAGIPLVHAWGATGAATGLLISSGFAAAARWLITLRVLERIPCVIGPPLGQRSGAEVG
jgi:O-antigen/teichoic acid export membrane protein